LPASTILDSTEPRFNNRWGPKEIEVMSEKAPQTLANHTRYDPLYHFFALPVIGLTVICRDHSPGATAELLQRVDGVVRMEEASYRKGRKAVAKIAKHSFVSFADSLCALRLKVLWEFCTMLDSPWSRH
jgi:hypothetical protein